MTGVVLSVAGLATLSSAQMATLESLKVSARQEVLGGSFHESLETWRDGPATYILGLCLLADAVPVGMTLFKRPPLSPGWVVDDAASIHGLKIAPPWQGRGWGHQAFRLVVAGMREAWPGTARLMLAVDAENSAALAVYRGFGMTDSGPIYDGRIGKEHHLTLRL